MCRLSSDRVSLPDRTNANGPIGMIIELAFVPGVWLPDLLVENAKKR